VLTWQRSLAAFGLIVMQLGLCATGHALAAESTLDGASVSRSVESLVALAEREVRASGGDLETQHAHWVFGFSTGHFALDPIRAQAARATALGLLDRLAVPGDLVSAFAFEMEVWPHAGSSADEVTVQDDMGATLAEVAGMLPLTPQAGSHGGHDTERALVSIADRVGQSSGPVVVVFTNRAASLTTDATARPLLGEDAEAYQTLLHSWRRAPAASRSGASLEARYDVERASGEAVATTVDIVLLTPSTFVSASMVAPRTDLVQARADRQRSGASEVSPEAPAASRRWALLASAMLAAGLLAAISIPRFGRFARGQGRGSDPVVTIQGAPVALDGITMGSVVCRVVARGFPEDDQSADHSLTIVHDDVPYGDEPLGRIVLQRGGLAWKDAAFQATRWRGRSARSPVPLGRRGGSLVIEGTVRERPGMPPRNVRTTLEIEMGGPA